MINISTRSNIAIKNIDNTIDSIYCHNDGYLEYNGVLLNYYYKDINKIRNLINLGDISCLEKKVNPEQGIPHSFDRDKRQKGVTVAYHRDRGEDLDIVKTRHYKSFDEYKKYFEDSWEEYAYLYDESISKWLCCKIPYSKEELVFTDLKIKLKEIGKEYIVPEEKMKVINMMIEYEKNYQHYEFNDVYESDEDAIFDIEECISTKDGIRNLIDILAEDTSDLFKNGDLSNNFEKEKYNSANKLLNELNKLINNIDREVEYDRSN